MMSTRTKRYLLWLSSLAMIGASIGLVVWEIKNPPQLEIEQKAIAASGAVKVHDPRHAIPDLVMFQPVWQLDLRRPLYDPPPVVTVEVKPKPPPLAIRLTGTIVEPGYSRGIFATPNGVELLATGATSYDATVLSIEPDVVTVRYYDEELKLTTVKTNDQKK